MIIKILNFQNENLKVKIRLRIKPNEIYIPQHIKFVARIITFNKNSKQINIPFYKKKSAVGIVPIIALYLPLFI